MLEAQHGRRPLEVHEDPAVAHGMAYAAGEAPVRRGAVHDGRGHEQGH